MDKEELAVSFGALIVVCGAIDTASFLYTLFI